MEVLFRACLWMPSWLARLFGSLLGSQFGMFINTNVLLPHCRRCQRAADATAKLPPPCFRAATNALPHCCRQAAAVAAAALPPRCPCCRCRRNHASASAAAALPPSCCRHRCHLYFHHRRCCCHRRHFRRCCHRRFELIIDCL
jgi:hypothetical protein